MEIVCLPENLDLRTLSHELRTPLVPILGLSQQLLETELTREQKNLINDIFVAGNQLLNLANELLKTKKLGNNNSLTDNDPQTVSFHKLNSMS